MKKLIVFIIVALVGFAMSCEKDSFLGYEQEVEELSRLENTPPPTTVHHKFFKANYTLIRAYNARKPSPGPVWASYTVHGSYPVLGELDASRSKEYHYPAAGESVRKAGVYKLIVKGILVSAEGKGTLRYEGKCLSSTKAGTMKGKYDFVYGSEEMKSVEGYMFIFGKSDVKGSYYDVRADGEMTTIAYFNN